MVISSDSQKSNRLINLVVLRNQLNAYRAHNKTSSFKSHKFFPDSTESKHVSNEIGGVFSCFHIDETD